MGKLDDQLKDLQRKRLKANFLKKLKSVVGNTAAEDFREVEKEVKDQVFAYFDAQVDMIEAGEQVDAEEETSKVLQFFSPEQVAILGTLADRAMGKAEVRLVEQPGQLPQPPQKPAVVQDKIRFALEHRHLGGKQVKLSDGSTGVVTGIDAPHIIVSLTNGRYVNVVPGDLIL